MASKKWILAAAFVAASLLLPNGAAGQVNVETQTLGGHASTVTSVAHTPSGRYVATGSADQTIKIWDAATGEELRRLQGHTGPVMCLAADPNNRYFVSGAGDNTLRLWDAPQPDPLAVFDGHTAPVRAVAASTNGERFLTAGDDRLARIWRIADGKLMVALDGLTAPITEAAYRNDNNQVALADAEGVIRLFNPLDGKPEGVLGAHSGDVTGLAYHPNNQQLISTGADGLLKVWRLPVPAPREMAEQAGPVRAVAITSNSQLALTASENAVRVFNPANGQLVRSLEGLAGPALSAAISGNNALAAAGGASGRMQFWSLGDGIDRHYLHGHDGAVPAVAYHPDNQRFVSAGDDGLIRIWRLPQPPTPLAGHTGDVLAVDIAAGGQFAATGSADKTVRLWNPANGQAIRAIQGHAEAVTTVAFGNDTAMLASGDRAGELRLWNPADGAPRGVLGSHAAPITSAAIHPSGNLLATTAEDGLLKVWNLPPAPPKSLPGHNAAVLEVAISADGAFSATGGPDGAVRLFDNPAGNALLTLPGHEGPVASLALDGVRLASGNADGVVTLWRFPATAEGKLQPQLPEDGSGGPANLLGHVGEVTDVVFVPNDETLVSAGADGTIRIWDLAAERETIPGAAMAATLSVVNDDGALIAVAGTVNERPTVQVHDSETGKVVAELLGHTGEVRAMAFNKDSTMLITGGADKTARLWDLSDAKFPLAARFDSPAEIAAVAVNDDGSQVFTGGADNVIRRWTAAGEESPAITGHTAAVNALAVRGELLVSGSQDGAVRVWNAETGAALRTISHGAPVIAVAISPDGSKIASASRDNSVKLWSAADGAALASLTGHTAPAARLRFRADGAQLLTTSTDGLRLFDAAGQLRERLAITEPAPIGAGFSNDRLISADADGSLRRFKPAVKQLIAGHEGAVHSVAAFADGRAIISGGADKTMRLWNLETGALVTTLAGPAAEVTAVATSPAGRQVAAACADGNLHLWSLPDTLPKEPLPPIRTIAHSAPLRDVSFGDNGRMIAACGDDNLVRIYDVAAGYELERFAGHTAPALAVAMADSAKTLVTGGGDNMARLWTMSLVRAILADEGKTNDAAFLADGVQLATAGDDMFVKLCDVEGKELRRLPGAKAPLVRLAVSPAGGQFAALDEEGRVLVWRSEGGEMQLVIDSPHSGDDDENVPRGGLAFTADGQRLLIAHNKRLRVCRASDGVVLQQFDQPDSIAAADVAPDNVVERRPDLVHPRLERMAGAAGPECALARGGIGGGEDGVQVDLFLLGRAGALDVLDWHGIGQDRPVLLVYDVLAGLARPVDQPGEEVQQQEHQR
ncbi:MAG: WD40 repeat domain-containing protein, partial [Planctomycetes bacterium]|nr:WD40 repeat domain-containing protein [Planctomycetota bacterium]